MVECSNATLVSNALEALNSGNPKPFLEMIAEDAVFYLSGDNPISGEYRGNEEIACLFQRIVNLTETPPFVEINHVLSGGSEHVVAIWTAYGTRKGLSYKGIAGYLFRLLEGKIVEARSLNEDQAEIDRFWSA